MLVRDLATEDCRAALSTLTFGRLACCHDGQPYIVPLHFAADGEDIFAFSMAGQKVEWMRENPRVCLEADSIQRNDEWTSIIVLGRFEELSDTPEFSTARAHALALLQKRVMWWEPGAIGIVGHADPQQVAPVVFRIRVDRMSGRRGVPAAADGAVSTSRAPRAPA